MYVKQMSEKKNLSVILDKCDNKKNALIVHIKLWQGL